MDALESIKAAAALRGLRFEGEMEYRIRIALFTDPRHGSTFAVKIEDGVEGLIRKAHETAEKFGLNEAAT